MSVLFIPPFMLFLAGAVIAAFVPIRSIRPVVILTAVVAGVSGYLAPDGVYVNSMFFKYPLELAVGTAWSNIAQVGLALSILLVGIASKTAPNTREHAWGLSAAAFASGAISAGDLVSMYLFLEALVISVVVIIASGRQPYSQSSAIHFIIIQLFASIVFKLGMSDFHHHSGTYSLVIMSHPISDRFLGWALLIGAMVKLSAWPLAYLTPLYVVGSSSVGRLYIVASLPLSGLACIHWLTGRSDAENIALFTAGGLMIAYAFLYSFVKGSKGFERSARWLVGFVGSALIALLSSNQLIENTALGLLPIALVLFLSALPANQGKRIDDAHPTVTTGGLKARDTDRLIKLFVINLLAPILTRVQSLWAELVSRLYLTFVGGLHAAKAVAGDRGLVGRVWGIGATSLWVIVLLGLYGVVYLVF